MNRNHKTEGGRADGLRTDGPADKRAAQGAGPHPKGAGRPAEGDRQGGFQVGAGRFPKKKKPQLLSTFMCIKIFSGLILEILFILCVPLKKHLWQYVFCFLEDVRKAGGIRSLFCLTLWKKRK